MQPLLVASIPHTGTMFTLNLLPGKWAALPGAIEPDRKYFCHFSEPHAANVIGKCFTIVPLRHYLSVQDSWRRRHMDLDELRRQWDHMLDLRGVFFLPIDRPGARDRRLKELSAELGVELKTDWVATNHG
jgi:hypothetical protein